MAKIKVSHLAPSLRLFCLHTDEDYWQKIVDDVSIRVLLGKAPKVGAGLSIIPSIGFTGWMAQVGKKDIIDT